MGTDELKKQIESEKQSRPLHELVVEYEFLVKSVVGNSHLITSRVGPLLIGGKNMIEETGYTSEIEIKVENEFNVPIKSLIFNGFSAIRGGDTVRALVPLYNERWKDFKNFYVSRSDEIREKEVAVRLTYAGRTDYSVDYENFKDPSKR